MIEANKSVFYDRILAPWPLFAGMVLAFFACCAAGHLCSQDNLFANFTRFHRHIHITSLFYPTASQVRALAKAHLDPAKIVVIVGGNSTLYGSGQRVERVWTRTLQEQLGEEFQVLNLATPGAQIMEFGGIAAETLRDDFPRLIVVTNHYPGNPLAEPDGHSQGTYFFWDAYYRGLLAKDMDREARLAKLARARRDDEKFAELKRQMRLDSWLAYRDLWTMMGHEHVWTLWNPTVAGAFTKARKHYRDVEFGPEGPPKHPRFTAPDARVMEVLRARIGPGYQKALSSLPPESNDGPPYANALERAVKLSCPAPLRKRTLITLNRLHPYYVDRLTSQEKAMHEQLYAAAAHTLETAGFTAINVERDNPYPRSAYFDHVHLSEEGGERLARDLAPKIQELARRLGYVGAKD